MALYQVMGYSSQEEMENDVQASIQKIAKYFQKNNEDFLGDIGLIDIYFDMIKRRGDSSVGRALD